MATNKYIRWSPEQCEYFNQLRQAMQGTSTAVREFITAYPNPLGLKVIYSCGDTSWGELQVYTPTGLPLTLAELQWAGKLCTDLANCFHYRASQWPRYRGGEYILYVLKPYFDKRGVR